MAPLSSKSAHTEVLAAACILKVRAAAEPRLGTLEAGEIAKKCLGSFDASNPVSYLIKTSGVTSVLRPSRPQDFSETNPVRHHQATDRVRPEMAALFAKIWKVDFAAKNGSKRACLRKIEQSRKRRRNGSVGARMAHSGRDPRRESAGGNDAPRRECRPQNESGRHCRSGSLPWKLNRFSRPMCRGAVARFSFGMFTASAKGALECPR